MDEQLMTAGEFARQQLVMRARKQLHEAEQLFTDVASWNDHSQARKEGADPIDPDPDGTMGKIRAALRVLIARESAREAQRFAKFA